MIVSVWTVSIRCRRPLTETCLHYAQGTVGMLVADVLFFIGADLFILQPLMTPLETLSGFFDIYYALVD